MSHGRCQGGNFQVHLLAVLPAGSQHQPIRALRIQHPGPGPQWDPQFRGLRDGTEHPVARLDRGEAALDLLPLRHQRGRVHHAGGNDGHRDRGLRADGQVLRSESGPRGRAAKSRSDVPKNGREQGRSGDPFGVPGGLPSGRRHLDEHGGAGHCLLTLGASKTHRLDLRGSAKQSPM